MLRIPQRLLLVALMAGGLILARPAAAQVEGDLNLTLGIPQGEFSENVDDFGIGADLFIGARIGDSPVILGGDLSFLVYGSDTRREPFSTTIPDVTVEVQTTNNIVNGHLVLRLQPPSGMVQPYLDALVGFKYLFTETTIENEGFGDQEPIATSTNFDDAAFSYGAGGGLKIQLWQGEMTDEGDIGTLYLNLGARYLFGGEAEYLKEGSIRRENGRVEFDVNQSKTDLLTIQLGVGLSF